MKPFTDLCHAVVIRRADHTQAESSISEFVCLYVLQWRLARKANTPGVFLHGTLDIVVIRRIFLHGTFDIVVIRRMISF